MISRSMESRKTIGERELDAIGGWSGPQGETITDGAKSMHSADARGSGHTAASSTYRKHYRDPPTVLGKCL